MRKSLELWEKVVVSERTANNFKSEFLAEEADRLPVLRTALRGKDRDIALNLALGLSVEEKKALFPEWVNLARCAHSPFGTAWTAILSLPRDWVLANIERETEGILQSEEETDYWMFLQLFEKLDRGLALKLAQRAAGHSVPEIGELGADWLERLQKGSAEAPQSSAGY